MKKLLLIAAVAALTLNVALWGQSIIVTSPARGNEWCLGSTHTITWTKSGAMPATVAVRLRRVGAPETELAVVNITDSTANDGSLSWTIPASVPAGDYFMRVRTSSPDVIGDSPNFKIKSCPPGGEPDFELNLLDRYFVWKIDPQHGGKALTIEIYINWYNHGADYQGPLKVHYMYLDALQGSKISKDAVLEIPSVSIAHNKGRKDHLCTVEKIPDGVSSITFAVMLDPDNQVKETDEKNNYRDLNVELSRQPDLAIEDVRYSTTEFHNYDPVDVYFTVRNKGIEQARQFNVRVTGDDEKGNILAYKNSMTIPLLGGCNDASGPPSYLPVHFRIQFTGEMPHSALFVIHVDYDNQVNEANEMNNKSWTRYYLLPTADLSFSSTRVWQESMTLHTEFSVGNKGDADADGVYVYIFIESHGSREMRKMIDMGKIPKGIHSSSKTDIQITWPSGKYLAQFIIAGCCKPGEVSNDKRYHDKNPADNTAEIWSESE
jgi:hypothetical protein